MYEKSVAPAPHIQTQQNGGDANNGQQSKSYRQDETSQSSGRLRLHDTRLLSTVHRPDETVAAAGQRFAKAGIFCRVAQRLADVVDGSIQVLVRVDEGVGPQQLLQFVAGHDLARPLQ